MEVIAEDVIDVFVARFTCFFFERVNVLESECHYKWIKKRQMCDTTTLRYCIVNYGKNKAILKKNGLRCSSSSSIYMEVRQ